MNAYVTLAFFFAVAAWLPGQSNPTHPYLLFHASDVVPTGPLYLRLVPPGAPLHPVYSTLATTIRQYTYNPTLNPNTSRTWVSDQIQPYIRDIADVAFRAAVEEHGMPRANTVYANMAIDQIKYILSRTHSAPLRGRCATMRIRSNSIPSMVPTIFCESADSSRGRLSPFLRSRTTGFTSS